MHDRPSTDRRRTPGGRRAGRAAGSLRRLLPQPAGRWSSVVVLAVAVGRRAARAVARAVPVRPDRLRRAARSRRHAGHLLGTDDLGRDLLSRVLLRAAGLAAGRASWRSRCPWWSACRSGWLAGFYRLPRPAGLAARPTRCSRSRSWSWRSGWPRSSAPSRQRDGGASASPRCPAVIRVARARDAAAARRWTSSPPRSPTAPATCGCSAGTSCPTRSTTLIVQATVAHPGRDHRRGGAVLPRPRHPAAGAVSLGAMLASAQPLFRDGPWLAVLPGVAIVVLDAGVQPARRRPARRARPEGRPPMTAAASTAASLTVSDLSVRVPRPRTARCSAVDGVAFEVAAGEVARRWSASPAAARASPRWR